MLLIGISFSGFSQTTVASSPKLTPSLLTVPGTPFVPQLTQADYFWDFFKKGSASLGLRLRYEDVNQDNELRHAQAITLRILPGFQTASYHDVDVFFQLINVSTPDYSTYNSTTNGNKQYSIIADPTNTAVNQAYLGYSGIPQSYFKLGRQIINLDNQRFVGSVDFRQNMQNFDAASFTNQYFKNMTVFLAYLGNIDTIFTKQIPSKDILINVKYSGMHFLDIIPYAYLLDHYGTYTLSLESTNTEGIRLNGTTSYRGIKYSYTAEYANQHSAANNPLNFDAYYYHLSFGLTWSILAFYLDQEVLSGNKYSSSNLAFRTPLATKHLFQGWADMFLTTPAEGIDDRFATLNITIPKFSDTELMVIYHDFQAQAGSTSLGNEWDGRILKQFGKRYSLGLDYADFKTSNVNKYPSTRKLWLTAAVNFA